MDLQFLSIFNFQFRVRVAAEKRKKRGGGKVRIEGGWRMHDLFRTSQSVSTMMGTYSILIWRRLVVFRPSVYRQKIEDDSRLYISLGSYFI
jgi:hypothetical protein